MEKPVLMECIKIIILLKSQLTEELKGLHECEAIHNTLEEIKLKGERLSLPLTYCQSVSELKPTSSELCSDRDVSGIFKLGSDYSPLSIISGSKLSSPTHTLEPHHLTPMLLDP